MKLQKCGACKKSVPVVIGAFGALSVNFKEYMKRIGVKVRKVKKEKRDLGPVVTCRNLAPKDYKPGRSLQGMDIIVMIFF